MESSDEARERLEAAGGPAFLTTWRHVLFVHLTVDAAVLQPCIPFPLDLWNGHAYVSIVLFRQERLHAARRGVLTSLVRAMTNQRVCNLRTYVRDGDTRGVYFLREWISDVSTAFLAPLIYGLPSIPAQILYEDDLATGLVFAQVVNIGRSLDLLAPVREGEESLPRQGSLDAFLVDRYVAFTDRGGRRCFRIWHGPWHQQRVMAEIAVDDLLREAGVWYETARLDHAAFSAGMDTVLIGNPREISPGS